MKCTSESMSLVIDTSATSQFTSAQRTKASCMISAFKQTVIVVVILAIAALATNTQATVVAADHHPNIIFIMADDNCDNIPR